MKRVYCIDCKWATRWWDSSGNWFCKSTLEQKWSWASGRGEKYLKLCDSLNCDGQCAMYRPGWRKRLSNWIRRK